MRRPLAWLATALVAAGILAMTLRPGHGQPSVHLLPFSEKLPALACLFTACRGWTVALRFLVIDVAGNAVVFVPFGAAIALGLADGQRARAWWTKVVLAGFALSLGIELAQLGVPGRVTDIDDLILNTLGAAAGGALVWLSRRRLVRSTHVQPGGQARAMSPAGTNHSR